MTPSSIFLLQAFIIVVGPVALLRASRLRGLMPWSVAFSLGSLLQSKGLTELVVLTILLDARIISPTIFTAMILMALVSTALTMPLARLTLAKTGGRFVAIAAAALPGRRP